MSCSNWKYFYSFIKWTFVFFILLFLCFQRENARFGLEQVVTTGIKPNTNYAVGATVQLLNHVDEYQHIRILVDLSAS